MSRDTCQRLVGPLVVCASLAACDGTRPGLLGDYVTAINAPQAMAPDAAVPALQADAGEVAAGATTTTSTVPPTAAPAAATPSTTITPPSQPAAGSSAPPAPTPRKADLVAVATEIVDELPVGIEQYVCTFTDLTIAEDTWVTAIEVVPQHPDYTFRASVSIGQDQGCDRLGVRHDLVFDSFASNPRLELREGDALLLPARSRVNVQVHHSGLSANAPSTDDRRTEVRLWTLPKGERPKYRVVRQPYHALNISIPVGAVDQTISTSAEIDPMNTPEGAEVIGITPVMNYLGQRVTAHVIAADGTETRLLELDSWSLDARKEYMLDPGSYIPLSRGAVHKQSCTYSNRPEDQASDADGRPMTPALTTFGEDARDEQCYTNVLYRYPL